MTPDLVLRGARIATPDGIGPADVVVGGGRILAVEKPFSVNAPHVMDQDDRLVLPGLVDSHVHVRDPGQTHKEDFASASAAALAGGITTMIAQPNTVPLVTDIAGFQATLSAGRSSRVDFAVGALAHESSLASIAALHAAGAACFDMFLGGGPDWLLTTDRTLQRRLFQAVGALGGVIGLYADDTAATAALGRGGTPADILAMHHPAIGAGALLAAAAMASGTGCRLHVRQTSSALMAAAVDALRRFAPDILVTAEVTPHHLLLTIRDFERSGVFGHIMPPLRTHADRDAMWNAVVAGTIDMVGTDHAPHSAQEKAEGAADLRRAPTGFPGLETMLPAVLTGLRARRLPDTLLPRLLAEAPARLFGLWPRKGAIAVGADADFAIVDDRAVAPVDPAGFHSKARHSPFAGMPLAGRVEHVLLRGKPAFARGEVIAPEGLGRFLNPREG